MTERERLIELINDCRCMEGYGEELVERQADHLLANGVMLVDTDAACLVTNREPIRTALGMPLDELAELIRAKRDGRIIIPPCKAGDTVYYIDTCVTAEDFGKKFVAFSKVKRISVDNEFVILEDHTAILWKYAFLTKEKAKKALAERSRG